MECYMKNSLVSTNAQKALNFLIQHPGKQLLANEVEKSTRISRAGVNFALRKLAKEKLVLREKKAKIYLYSVDPTNSVIKQLKVLRTVLLLHSFINKIKTFSQKVVLFGSCARGDNIANSDIDLFILTNSPKTIEEEIKKTNLKEKLQPIIRNPTQFIKMEKEESVFFEEIERGITLWEFKDESRI
jgi:predicted nucleotidyltransferase